MGNPFKLGGFEKRLAALFLLLSVPPTLLIAFFSARYFMQSVQLVSNPGVEQSFANSMEIARDFSAKLEEDASCAALRLADEYERAGSPGAGGVAGTGSRTGSGGQAGAGTGTDGQAGAGLAGPALDAALAKVIRETHADFAAVYGLDGGTWHLRTAQPAGFARLDAEIDDARITDSAVNGRAPAGTDTPTLQLRDPDVIASGLARGRTLFVAGYALEQGFADKIRGTADDLSRYHAVGLYVSAQRRYMIIVTSILVAAAVIASALLSRLVARRISHPITELAHATEHVAKGDLEHRVVVPARDEVLSLVNGFNKMTQELQENRANLIAAAKREAEVARDFEIARQVQESLFPTALPLIPGWEFATTCRTAEVVGGDYHDVFEVAPGKVLFAIGDVMGKSVGASLTMASVHAVVRSAGATLGSETTLPKLIEELNRYLVSSHTREMFVTLFLGIIDTAQGRIWYVNCGHPPGLLVRDLNGAPEKLESGGLVLGVTDAAVFEVGEARLDAGNTLVLVSDGVTEAMNPREHLYGDERLALTVGDGHDLGAIETMQRILDSVDDFAEGAKQHDDISIVVVRRAV